MQPHRCLLAPEPLPESKSFSKQTLNSFNRQRELLPHRSKGHELSVFVAPGRFMSLFFKKGRERGEAVAYCLARGAGRERRGSEALRCEDVAERWAPPRLSGALGRSSGTGLSGAPPAGLEPRARGRPAAAPSVPPAGLRARRCPRGGSSASTERTGSAASLRHERSDSCSPSPAVLGEAAEARRREGGGVLAVPHGCPSPAQPQLCPQWLQTPPALPSPRAPHPYTYSLLPGARRAQQRFGCCLSCRVTWAPTDAFGMGQILHLPSHRSRIQQLLWVLSSSEDSMVLWYSESAPPRIRHLLTSRYLLALPNSPARDASFLVS